MFLPYSGAVRGCDLGMRVGRSLLNGVSFHWLGAEFEGKVLCYLLNPSLSWRNLVPQYAAQDWDSTGESSLLTIKVGTKLDCI